MAGEDLYLGIDAGTQSTKAILYNPRTKTVLGRGSYAHELLYTTVAGRAEQHPSSWIQGVTTAVRQALQGLPDGAQVKGLGVSGQQHGMVVLDADHKVLRPAKLWCDTQSAAEAKELAASLSAPWLVPSFTITKLLWLKRNEPDTWSKVAHVLLPHDYINYWLTGRMVAESGDASGTGYFDVSKRQWDTRAMAAVDEQLAGWVPAVVGPHEVIGTLTPEAADALGLPTSVAVSPGSGDNAMAALGAGVAEAGQVVVSLGTSGTVFAKTPEPILDHEHGSICPFCDATGGGLPLLCTLNCTLPLQEVASAFGMGHEELAALAAAEPAGCSGISFLPYLVGERTPNWPHASGAITGLRPGCLKPGLLYRAALEGATLALLAGLRRMVAAGLAPSEVRLVGGGSRSALWRQVVADAFQLPVRLPLEAESAALGAALQAAACHQGVPVGEFVAQHPPPLSDEVIQPDPSQKAAYEAALQRLEAAGQKLFGSSS